MEITYQESHFPSNQADFRLIFGAVVFSPSSPPSPALPPAFPVICVSFSVTLRRSAATKDLSRRPSPFATLDVQFISRILPPGHEGLAPRVNYGCSSPWLPITRVQGWRGARPLRIPATGGCTQIPSLAPSEDLADLCSG